METNLLNYLSGNLVSSMLYLTELVMTNPCSTHPCLNNGTCFDDANSAGMNLKLLNALDFRCFCPIGYSGIVCESKKKKCLFFCHSLDLLLVHTKEINVPLFTYFNNGMKGNEKVIQRN